MSDPALGVLAAGLAAATVIDLRTRRIPNVLTATMMAGGVALAATGVSGISVPASLLGFFLGLLFMMPGYALGATGAGDVKLMAAVGALVGSPLIVWAFLFTAVAGGVLAVLVAARRKRLAATLTQTGKFISAPEETPKEIRAAGAASRFAYAPAVAVGSIVAVLIR
jgi:prepilin peptidase CpaA